MPTHVDPWETAHRFRDLVADADLPEPDEVVVTARELTFFWHESKLVVVVDLEP